MYGFGIMLWEMFTGKLPWSDKNYHQVKTHKDAYKDAYKAHGGHGLCLRTHIGKLPWSDTNY